MPGGEEARGCAVWHQACCRLGHPHYHHCSSPPPADTSAQREGKPHLRTLTGHPKGLGDPSSHLLNKLLSGKQKQYDKSGWSLERPLCRRTSARCEVSSQRHKAQFPASSRRSLTMQHIVQKRGRKACVHTSVSVSSPGGTGEDGRSGRSAESIWRTTARAQCQRGTCSGTARSHTHRACAERNTRLPGRQKCHKTQFKKKKARTCIALKMFHLQETVTISEQNKFSVASPII